MNVRLKKLQSQTDKLKAASSLQQIDHPSDYPPSPFFYQSVDPVDHINPPSSSTSNNSQSLPSQQAPSRLTADPTLRTSNSKDMATLLKLKSSAFSTDKESLADILKRKR